MKLRTVRVREDGFTLIEIVIAMFVLTFAVLGMASVMAGTSQRHNESISHTELVAAAESKFEDLRSYAATGSVDAIELAIGGSLTSDDPDHFDQVEGQYGRWIRRRWEVTDGPAATVQVRLRVEPKFPLESDHDRIDMTTLVEEP